MTLKEFTKKIFSPILWGNFLAMFLVLVALAFGLWKGLERYTHHGESINVPSVKGMSVEQARQALRQQNLECTVIDSSYNRSQPPGIVLEQTPAGGSKVKSGREIFLTINALSSPTRPIPDIADNCSLREAEARLKALGFKLGPIEAVDGERDWVYGVKSGGRNVYTGVRVPIDVPIVLQVGTGYDDFDEDEEAADEDFASDDIDIFAGPEQADDHRDNS